MHARRALHLAAVVALAAAALGALAPAIPAATREPLRDALAATRLYNRAQDSSARPDAAALRAMLREAAQRYGSAADRFRIASDHFGPAELESVGAALRSLDHGPELGELSVFVATGEQLQEACGEEVLACYFPLVKEMVVSGVDRPVGGVTRDFAIAHEYGHHIANMRAGGDGSEIAGGTLRWATYERVCQLTRRGRLPAAHGGASYWRDPEEAFAQAYALLNRPGDRAHWDYAPLLQPTATSLAKIHADVSRPWTGPVESRWRRALAAPPPEPAAAGVRAGAIGVGAGRAVGDPPWLATRLLRTPLDGAVTVSVRTPEGTGASVALRDPKRGRVLARGAAGPDGYTEVSHPNCGNAALRIEVRATEGPVSFDAELTRP